MHAEEARLTRILKTISNAGIACTSTLRVHPSLWSAFTAALMAWMSRLPLHTNLCQHTINRCNMTFEDVAGDIMCKLLAPERRMDRNPDKPYLERLNNSLHPQLDLVLALNAGHGAHEALIYLVTVCQSYCKKLNRPQSPVIIQTPPEELHHWHEHAPESSALHSHTANFISDVHQKEAAFTIVRQFDGQDFLHDYAILGMHCLNMSCSSLVQFLMLDQAEKSAVEMAEMISTMISIDCKGDEALCKFIESARTYRLPARYREDPEALARKLYRATTRKSLLRLCKRIQDSLS